MRSFLAVTRQTFIEALRTRIVLAVLAVLALCLLGLAAASSGDGTLTGRIQTFLSYSVSVTELLLAAVTVFLTTGIVCGDIRRKSIFLVLTKPLSRWAYLAGRWAGILLLNAAILAPALAGIYGLSQYLRSLDTPLQAKKDAGLVEKTREDLDRIAIDNEIFTARLLRPPDPVDVQQRLAERVDMFVKADQYESRLVEVLRQQMQADAAKNQGRSAAVSEEEAAAKLRNDPAARRQAEVSFKQVLREALVAETLVVQPALNYPPYDRYPGPEDGPYFEMSFSGLGAPPPGQAIHVRYRVHPLSTPAGGVVGGFWTAYDPDNGWTWPQRAEDPGATATSSFHTIPIAGERFVRNGTLKLRYYNDAANGMPVKFESQDVSVLYRVGSFESNLARGALLMLVRLAFVAAVSLFAAVFMSFPLAALVPLVVLLVGTMGNFAADSVRLGPVPTRWDLVAHHAVNATLALLPDYDRTSPVDALLDGREISAGTVAREYFFMPNSGGVEIFGRQVAVGTGPQTLLMLLWAGLILRYRELARVQV
jgi:hypothetical protein